MRGYYFLVSVTHVVLIYLCACTALQFDFFGVKLHVNVALLMQLPIPTEKIALHLKITRYSLQLVLWYKSTYIYIKIQLRKMRKMRKKRVCKSVIQTLKIFTETYLLTYMVKNVCRIKDIRPLLAQCWPGNRVKPFLGKRFWICRHCGDCHSQIYVVLYLKYKANKWYNMSIG